MGKMDEKNETSIKENIYPRIILGLDISTACIGIAIIEDNGDNKQPNIIAITHKSPKVPKKIKGIESLFLRKIMFEEGFLKCINEYTDKKITDVVIEEPLLSSNNVNTVATLLRFNGMIADSIYNTLNIVPSFISSYDARMYSFPQLVSLRKYNKKNEVYPIEHIIKAIKKNNIVLFGNYPYDIDKKSIMMDMVNEIYNIPWSKDKNDAIRKENYDACDALICALAYVNINRHSLEKPSISKYNKTITDDNIVISYTTHIWDLYFDKQIFL